MAWTIQTSVTAQNAAIKKINEYSDKCKLKKKVMTFDDQTIISV